MKRWALIILACLLLCASILYYLLAARFEYNTNAYVKEQYTKGNTQALYDFYFSGDPLLEARPVFLNASLASPAVTMIVVTDFLSTQNRVFYEQLFPQIRSRFLDPGQAAVYEKYYIPRQEYEQQTGRFMYVVAAFCIGQDTNVTPEQFEQFHLQLFLLQNATNGTVPSPDTFADIAVRLGIPKYQFLQCIDASRKDPPRAIYEDMLETDLFRIESPSLLVGIGGLDNIVLIGIPSMAQVTSAMREKQINLGI